MDGATVLPNWIVWFAQQRTAKRSLDYVALE